MLDPSYVRDHQEEVRRGLQNRGWNVGGRSRAARDARKQETPADSGARRSEARSECGRRRSGAGQASREGRERYLRGEPAARAADTPARHRARSGRTTALDHPDVAAERAARQRPRRQERSGQRGRAHVGRADEVRFRAARALGSRARAGHSGIRARHEDVGREICAASRRRRAIVARAYRLHARCAHARARIPRGRAAVSRQSGIARGNGTTAEVRSRPLQGFRRMGPLSDSHGRGTADEYSSRRDSERRPAAAEVHGLHAVLSQRSGIVRQRRARPHQAAPVREGRDGEDHAPRHVVRRARVDDAECGRRAPEARSAVPHDGPEHRRHRLLNGEDIRRRGVASGPERVQGNFLVQQRRGVSGPQGEHQIQGGWSGESRVRAHAERIGVADRPHAGRRARKLPAEGRVGARARRAAPIHGRAGSD